MSRKDLERRIAALERRLNAEQPSGTSPLRVVIVHGMLPPGEPLWGVAGTHEWLRDPGEDLDAFTDRAAAAAIELREPFLVLGGLPSTQAQKDLALAAYDAWLLTDDGVPPCEPSRGVPR
jgi:hypothetical protein